MPRLPDVIPVGPFPLPTLPLALLLGAYLFLYLAGRWAKGWGLDRAWVDQVAYRALVGAAVGAKLAEVLRSPASFVASPRLLVSVPLGSLPLAAALLGAVLWAAPALRRHRSQWPRVLDAMAIPFGLGLSVAALGSGQAHSLLLAVALLLATGALAILRPQAAFHGHTALGAMVLGSLALVTADLFRPAPTLTGGLTTMQLWTAAVGLAAYLVALRLEARRRWAAEQGSVQGRTPT